MSARTICAFALLLGAPAAAKDKVPPAPTIKGNPAQYFGPDNYPPEAIRAQEQGRVVAELRVGPDGVVAGCTIVASSGSASLDAVTCASARKVAFEPAHDRRGRAIASTYRLPVRWMLPQGDAASFSPIAGWSAETELRVSADSQLRSCVFRADGVEQRDDPNCAAATAKLPEMLARLPADLQYRDLILFDRSSQAFVGLKPPPPFAEPAARVLERIVIRFTVAADGSVSNCRVDGDADSEAFQASPPCNGKPPFRPLHEPVTYPLEGVQVHATLVKTLP